MAEAFSLQQFLQLGEPLTGIIAAYQALRAPQALLVSGPFGVGKQALCMALAQTLLCSGLNRPCLACADCLRAKNDNHPNMLVVTAQAKQKTVKVEQARQLLEELSSYPFSPGRRVVLLELADTFTIPAQNALLKAIEEPDPDTYFLLTARQEKAVLPTIRSRCRHLRFPLWPNETIAQQLMDRGLEKNKAQQLAALSGGSPGRATQLLTDPNAAQVQALAEDTILSLKSLKDVPEASAKLRDAKDLQEPLLDYVEHAACALINRESPISPDNQFAKRLITSVLDARRYLASNVSWQAVADMMLLQITEDT